MVTMASSARTDDRHAACVLDTQETLVCRPQISGRRPWSPEETHASWLEEVLAFADRAPTSLGVVFTMLDQFDVSREEDILRSRAPGDSSHACFSQWLRMSRCRREVGTRYVRFPRWGTLYSHAHVAQLGGTAKIVEAVRPAVVREFGLGVYFQLTESFDSAMSEESLAKQGAFETLAAPLLPPA
ncbi:MAG: hypothetical protein IPL61_09565 [Myxococcales bacterium]|nr:hypothetical protein [Myxococcales bacterium]